MKNTSDWVFFFPSHSSLVFTWTSPVRPCPRSAVWSFSLVRSPPGERRSPPPRWGLRPGRSVPPWTYGSDRTFPRWNPRWRSDETDRAIWFPCRRRRVLCRDENKPQTEEQEVSSRSWLITDSTSWLTLSLFVTLWTYFGNFSSFFFGTPRLTLSYLSSASLAIF